MRDLTAYSRSSDAQMKYARVLVYVTFVISSPTGEEISYGNRHITSHKVHSRCFINDYFLNLQGNL